MFILLTRYAGLYLTLGGTNALMSVYMAFPNPYLVLLLPISLPLSLLISLHPSLPFPYDHTNVHVQKCADRCICACIHARVRMSAGGRGSIVRLRVHPTLLISLHP